ncbi:hypothetical protein FGRMN_3056 [Fusarium graminum]|nr:hypothetical protein FGRMN_3056 [Fusarium graminum]
MASSHYILLQNATLLVPETSGDDRIVPLKNHSLLIEGNRIVCIAADIDPPSAATEVIDCTSKIIAPGFIDTHHHVWQTQVKGRHADQTLLEYMAPGNMVCHSYTPEDAFWGQLGGCIEALEAGTTTIVDHAHISYSPEHNNAALSGTISSGIRSIYCYCPIGRVKTWKPFALEDSLLPDWLFEQLETLCKAEPFGDGRVTMGFAFDFFFLPKEVIVGIYTRVRNLGIKTITSHYVPSIMDHSVVGILESYGILDKDILLSHVNPLSDSEAKKIEEAGAAVSSTPDTELQMGHGWPVCFQDNAKSFSSLGIDCHSNNTGSIVAQMRVGLQAERARRNETVHSTGKFPGRIQVPTQEAFQLGTIRGAKAIHMEDQLGSLEEGKIADLVIWDTLSPGMICAAEEDPIGAIILHSAPSDIDAVIVDGHFRKRDGRLLSTKVNLELFPELELRKSELEWRDIAVELLESRRRIIEAEKASGADDRETAFDSGLSLINVQKSRLAF